MKSPDKKEACCEKCKDRLGGNPDLGYAPKCSMHGYCPCHNKVEVSECCGAEERGVSVNLDSSAPHQKYYGRICSKCGQPFVAEKCDSIEKAGVVCKDCSAPPQESKECRAIPNCPEGRCIHSYSPIQESKASWEEEFDLIFGRKGNRTESLNWEESAEQIKSFISNLLSKAKTEERENTEVMIPIWSKEVAEQARKALLADLAKKVVEALDKSWEQYKNSGTPLTKKVYIKSFIIKALLQEPNE